jgi:hypothetical protein
MYRWFCFTLAALLPLSLGLVTLPDTPGLVWWTTHAMVKVRPYDREPSQRKEPIKIQAARNEFEPFQVILRAPANDIDAINIEITDLDGPGSSVIPNSNVSVYLEKYLNVKTPSAVDGAAGEWPDALIPSVDRYTHEKRAAFPFELVRRRNQPVWVEVYVPPSSPPGLYEGKVHVLISGDRKISIPFQLEVWNFTLPSTSSLVTTFGLSGMGAVRRHFGKYTNDEELYDISFLYQKSALLHRISVHGGSGVPPAFSVVDGQVQIDWKNFDAENGPFMDGLVFAPNEPLFGARATSIAVRTPDKLTAPEHRIQYWQLVARHFRDKGWMDRLFNYLWDEPAQNQFPAMIELGKVVHRADPEIKNLVTAPLHREWADFIGIWSPVINCFERRPGHDDYCEMTVERPKYDSELAQGKKLWWYQACSSHGCNIVGGDYFTGWPSYMVDHDSVQHRIMEWFSWKYGVEGELYFNMNEAYFKLDPWKDIRLFGGNGDGTLFYPGRPDVIGGTTHIPIESIRLKLIREGLEDYEYLVMLEKMAGRATVGRHVDSLIRRTYDFDHDPEKLYAVRRAMGERLSEEKN